LNVPNATKLVHKSLIVNRLSLLEHGRNSGQPGG
jgi:hypothetical protein